MFFFKKSPQPVGPIADESTPEAEAAKPEEFESGEPEQPVAEVAPQPPIEEEQEAPVSAPRVKSRAVSPLTVVILGLFALTLGVAGFLAWLASQATDMSQHREVDSSDLVGVWGFENVTRQSGEMPVILSLSVYPTRLEFSNDQGREVKQGEWRNNGFWCQAPDSTDEVEVAKITSPEELELHESAFEPNNPKVDVLYKEQGNAAEMKAIADKYPPPITYPPPAGVIKYWMTEYELTTLPWKPDHLEITGDEPYSLGVVYVYRSDDPHLDKLQVTVKNHRVVEVKGGNG